MTDPLLAKSLIAAELMADTAGKEILHFFRQSTHIDNKLAEGFDPVTQADRQAELVIRKIIEETFPEDGIIGEEFGIKGSANGRNWVLDPIDGTRAFISGLPVWGTLIALQQDGQAVLGLLDQPYTGERWIGQATHTDFVRHGQRHTVKTRACDGLARATLMTTSPDILSDSERRVFYDMAAQTRLTRYGCDCYAYAMVASGQVDLVIESGLQPYDIQALIPIIEGAGGLLTDWSGGRVSAGGRVLAAGDPAVHAQALEILAKA